MNEQYPKAYSVVYNYLEFTCRFSHSRVFVIKDLRLKQ